MGVNDVFVLCYFQHRQVNLSLRRWCSNQTANTRLNIRPGSQVSFHVCLPLNTTFLNLSVNIHLTLI